MNSLASSSIEAAQAMSPLAGPSRDLISQTDFGLPFKQRVYAALSKSS